MNQQLAILDAGAQYGKVIDRKVRELAVESVLLPMNTPATELKKYQAIIISGGPESVYGEKAPKYDPELFTLGVPILGICYGMQLMNYVHGGTVEKKSKREDGQCTISVMTDSELFKNFDAKQDVLMTHGDTVDKVANGFRQIADSEGLLAAIEDTQRKMYGVQFHPEVDLTLHGKELLKHFLYDIAGFTGDFTVADREQTAIAYIQEKVGTNDVLVLLSGGVDSTVLAALLAKALPADKIHAIHIDTGFMRLGESQQVVASLEKLGLQVKLVDAQATFRAATTTIKGVETPPLHEATEPEHKRKIIGDTFVKVAQQAIADFNLDPDTTILAQGSLRPDLIESASTHISKVADTIKTHHNDTFLVRELRDKGRVVEPLSEYHKDEVRELATRLGLPEEIAWRQPFPGPGLAIRILCGESAYMTEDYEDINQGVRTFVGSEYGATLLPIRTVGVQGDGRTYSYAVAISGPQNWSELMKLAREIPKHFHKINRVVYLFGEKFNRSLDSITETRLQPEVVEQLRQADAIVNEVLLKHDLIKPLSQVPVILVPVTFDETNQRSIAIRTFITNDFMTGVPATPNQHIPASIVQQMVDRILGEVKGISRVMYDLTSKPPGTTEWE